MENRVLTALGYTFFGQIQKWTRFTFEMEVDHWTKLTTPRTNQADGEPVADSDRIHVRGWLQAAALRTPGLFLRPVSLKYEPARLQAAAFRTPDLCL